MKTLLLERLQGFTLLRVPGSANTWHHRAHLVSEHGKEEVFVKGLGKAEPNQLSLQDEARLLCELSPHPNVIGYRGLERVADSYDDDDDDDSIDYSTPRLVTEGGTLLFEVLCMRPNAPLPVEAAAYIVLSILNGLRHVHSIGMVHNDVKPHNVVLGRHGEVKLKDFDNARRMLKAHNGHPRGSLHFMSPEALQNAPLDARSDLWSVGVVMHVLLAGRPPWESSMKRETWHRALAEKILTAPLSDYLERHVPLELSRIIRRLLEKEPSKRFKDATAVIEALEAAAPDAYSLRTRDELARLAQEAKASGEPLSGVPSNTNASIDRDRGDEALLSSSISLTPIQLAEHFYTTFGTHIRQVRMRDRQQRHHQSPQDVITHYGAEDAMAVAIRFLRSMVGGMLQEHGEQEQLVRYVLEDATNRADSELNASSN